MGERDSEQQVRSAILDGGDMLGTAVDFARAFARESALAPADEARLCILVEELVANLADHGTPGPVPPMLALMRQPEAVRLVLTDSGSPFDPRAASPEPTQRDRGGGAGLAIVRAWAEILGYQSGNGRNRLTVRFPLGGARGEPARSHH